jgi:hypothetical protein
VAAGPPSAEIAWPVMGAVRPASGASAIGVTLLARGRGEITRAFLPLLERSDSPRRHRPQRQQRPPGGIFDDAGPVPW